MLALQDNLKEKSEEIAKLNKQLESQLAERDVSVKEVVDGKRLKVAMNYLNYPFSIFSPITVRHK